MRNFNWVLIFVIISTLSACGVSKTKAELAEADSRLLNEILFETANPISITNGKTGEVVILTKKEQIESFLSLLEGIQIKRIEVEKSGGYPYAAKIGNIQLVFFPEKIKINKIYYQLNKKIPINEIGKYFERDGL